MSNIEKPHVVPELGDGTIIGSDDEYWWFEYQKFNVTIRHSYDDNEIETNGFELSKSIDENWLSNMTRDALDVMPSEYKQRYGGDPAQWEIGVIDVNSNDYFIIELENKNDGDHGYRFVYENEKLEFECRDG